MINYCFFSFCSWKKFFGLVKMTFGPVDVSYWLSLHPELYVKLQSICLYWLNHLTDKLIIWCLWTESAILWVTYITTENMLKLRTKKLQSVYIKFKNLFMLSVRISSYGCTWEVWRAWKMRESIAERNSSFLDMSALQTSQVHP